MSDGPTTPPSDPPVVPPLGREHSGKKFVIGSLIVILMIWAVLFLSFRDWKGRHQRAAAFGRSEVAAAVDPLASRVPPEVDARVWKQAVEDSHAMLEAVTGAGLLDRSKMEELLAELLGRFRQTTPESARDDLRWLWDQMEARAGPILTRRAERPPLVPPRPAILGPGKSSDANGIDMP